jgi:hypothetical protein
MNSIPNIHQIGSTASRLLSQPDFHGEVIASVRGAIYLRSESDEVVWLSDPNSSMHTRNVQLSTPLLEVPVGTAFSAYENRLHLGNSLSLELSEVAVWNDPQLDQDRKPSLGKINQELKHLLPRFSKDIGKKGFGVLMMDILKIPNSDKYPSGQSFPDAFRTRSAPIVNSVLAILRQGRFDSLFDSVAPLVGLGAGLTPSGDDFLGGLLFTLHNLAALFPREIPLDKSRLDEFIADAKSRTHLISWTLLRDLSHGNGIEPVHVLVNHLFSTHSTPDLLDALHNLTSIGHSTGSDLLAGILAGFQAGTDFVP